MTDRSKGTVLGHIDERVRHLSEELRTNMHFVLERFEKAYETGRSIAEAVSAGVAAEVNNALCVIGYLSELNLRGDAYDLVLNVKESMASVLQREWDQMVDAARKKGEPDFSALKEKYIGIVRDIYQREFHEAIDRAFNSTNLGDATGDQQDMLGQMKRGLHRLERIFDELGNLNKYLKAGPKRDIIYSNRERYQLAS